MERKAVYAGSFNPFTNGHLAVVEAAYPLFDTLYVVVAANPDKSTDRFSPAERVAFIEASVKHLPNVKVVNLHGVLVVNWAFNNGCRWMVRGLRTPADLVTEREIERTNSLIEPHIQTLYLPAPASVDAVSSSIVMGLVGKLGWQHSVRKLVPEPVYVALRNADLKRRFTRWAWGGNEHVEKVWQKIVASYSGPERRYHNLDHIMEVTDHITEFGDDLNTDDTRALMLSAFFHDYIQGSQTGKDEDLSAEAAGDFVRQLGLKSEVAAKVVYLVAVTYKSGDGAIVNDIAKLFLDADMAVLGKRPEDYQRYAQQIREEYARFPDVEYKKRRIDGFLKPTLNREFIFRTQPFRARFEEQSRVNLANELSTLQDA